MTRARTHARQGPQRAIEVAYETAHYAAQELTLQPLESLDRLREVEWLADRLTAMLGVEELTRLVDELAL